ncbi:chemotaxis protein CheA [Steroidobacter denitrificans]|uniref:Chemotaxis protein CheA n=1 Tax=Steroidobacter denitrificans TaxID=465721 RepID=A0A127F7H7_STEDE|nr:chemotaxis protein CheA [Steroidobacter denitrificans]AMN46374.1 chemotaxis protein CheA [Steroidobacter denitrificans]
MKVDLALSTFVVESCELLREMEAALLACEHGGADDEAINAIFRAAHTIKGSSGLFGLDAIVAFTHIVEGVLDRVRSHEIKLDRELAAVLLECRDHMQSLVDAVTSADCGSNPQHELTGAGLLERLTAMTDGGTSQEPRKPATVPAMHALESEFHNGWRARTDSWHISVRFHADVLKNGMDPLSFIRYLTTLGSITGLQVVDEALPDPERFDPESCYLGFEISLKSDAEKQQIEAAFEFVQEDCALRILPPRSLIAEYVSLIRDMPQAHGRLGELLVNCGTLTRRELDRCLALQNELQVDPALTHPLGQLLAQSHLVQPPVIKAALQKQREAGAAGEGRGTDSRSLRVDGVKLDHLIDLVGELVIAGAATNLIARRVGFAELHESTQRLARLVEDIRDQALQLRMVPIGATFARFRRVVRDVARETGKQIRLEVSGADTELDKTLIESIADPLTHLVRNAIDHGIERPDIRRERGKRMEGLLHLNAYHDSGSVVVEVSDDGNGLNRERIERKALERGLISDAAGLSDAQVYALIFEPGFSTAEQVTNLSGRGVGMDVVKRNVTALRGTVEVDSREGAGTLVRIRMPLTLAIIDGFLVGVGRSSFVIPLDLVEECVELTQDERAAAVGHRYIDLRGSTLPFIRLRELLGIPGVEAKRESIVVVRCGEQRAGIVVDELLGELQAVIKPLSKIFSGLQGISGSTILGSGEIALILDVGGMIERSLALGDRHADRGSAAAASNILGSFSANKFSGVMSC